MSGPASAPLARPAILGAALCLGVLLTVSPILRNDFVNFDDGPCVLSVHRSMFAVFPESALRALRLWANPGI